MPEQPILDEIYQKKQAAEAMNPASQPSYDAAIQNSQMISQGITPVIPEQYKPAATPEAPSPMAVGRAGAAVGLDPTTLSQIVGKAYHEYVRDQSLRNITRYYPQTRPTQYWVRASLKTGQPWGSNATPDDTHVIQDPGIAPLRGAAGFPEKYGRLVPVPEGMTPEEAIALQKVRDADWTAYTTARTAGILSWIPGMGELSSELLPEIKEFESEYYATHDRSEIVSANLVAVGASAPIFPKTIGGKIMGGVFRAAYWGTGQIAGLAAKALAKNPTFQEAGKVFESIAQTKGYQQSIGRLVKTKAKTGFGGWFKSVFPGAEAKAVELNGLSLASRLNNVNGAFLKSGEISVGHATPSQIEEIVDAVKKLRTMTGQEDVKIKLVHDVGALIKEGAKVTAASTATGAGVLGFDLGIRGRSLEAAKTGAQFGAAFGAAWGLGAGLRAGFSQGVPTELPGVPSKVAAAPVPTIEQPRIGGYFDPVMESPVRDPQSRISRARLAMDARDKVNEQLGGILRQLKDADAMSKIDRAVLEARAKTLQTQKDYYQGKFDSLTNENYPYAKGK